MIMLYHYCKESRLLPVEGSRLYGNKGVFIREIKVSEKEFAIYRKGKRRHCTMILAKVLVNL